MKTRVIIGVVYDAPVYIVQYINMFGFWQELDWFITESKAIDVAERLAKRNQVVWMSEYS